MEYNIVVLNPLQTGISDEQNYVDAIAVMETISTGLLQLPSCTKSEFSNIGRFRSIVWNNPSSSSSPDSIKFSAIALPNLNDNSAPTARALMKANMLIICLNSSELMQVTEQSIRNFLAKINFYGEQQATNIPQIPIIFVSLRHSASSPVGEQVLRLCQRVARPSSTISEVMQIDMAGNPDLSVITTPLIEMLQTPKGAPLAPPMLLSLLVRAARTPTPPIAGGRTPDGSRSPQGSPVPIAMVAAAASPLRGRSPQGSPEPPPAIVAAIASADLQQPLPQLAGSQSRKTITLLNLKSWTDRDLPDRVLRQLSPPISSVSSASAAALSSRQETALSWQVCPYELYKENSRQIRILEVSAILILCYEFSKAGDNIENLTTSVQQILGRELKKMPNRPVVLVLIDPLLDYRRKLTILQATMTDCFLDIVEISLASKENIDVLKERIQQIINVPTGKTLRRTIYEALPLSNVVFSGSHTIGDELL